MKLVAWSAPGEYGKSMDTFEESLVCREEREPMELALSTPPPKYLSSSPAFLLSFFELREKNDLPPDDCLDLLSAADMVVRRRKARFDHRCAPYGYLQVGCA
jgi:hypothetical protein